MNGLPCKNCRYRLVSIGEYPCIECRDTGHTGSKWQEAAQIIDMRSLKHLTLKRIPVEELEKLAINNRTTAAEIRMRMHSVEDVKDSVNFSNNPCKEAGTDKKAGASICSKCGWYWNSSCPQCNPTGTSGNATQEAEPTLKLTRAQDYEDLEYLEKQSSEADPTGKKPSDPGAKLDAGKPRASLLRQVGLALLEVAKVLTIGAQKYSANGWIAVPNGEVRYDDAFWRHILYAATEAVDKDTGLPHDVQEAVNALFKLELRLRREKNESEINTGPAV